jgi:hypothetical protein
MDMIASISSRCEESTARLIMCSIIRLNAFFTLATHGMMKIDRITRTAITLNISGIINLVLASSIGRPSDALTNTSTRITFLRIIFPNMEVPYYLATHNLVLHRLNKHRRGVEA